MMAWLSASTLCCTFDEAAKDTAFFQGRLYVLTTKHVYEIAPDHHIRQRFGSFKDAQALAVGKDGIFVTDPKQYKVFVFGQDGNLRTSWGGRGNGNEQFRRPMGIGIDSEGLVYVADQYAKLVKVFDANGRFIMKFKAGRVKLQDLTIDENFVYVSDVLSNIMVYDKDDGMLRRTIGPKNGKYATAQALRADKHGGLFVGYRNDCLLHLDKSDNVLERWGKACGGKIAFSGISGIGYTPTTLFVADWHKHGVVAIALKQNKNGGQKTTRTQLPVAVAGRFMWQKPASNIKADHGLLWQDSPVNKKLGFSYRQAQRYCRDLKENFFGYKPSFRLPSLEALQQIKDHRKLFDFVVEGGHYWSNTKGGFGHWGYKVAEGQLLPSKDSYTSAAGLYVRCVAPVPIDMDKGASLSELVDRFAEVLGTAAKTSSAKIPSPHYIKPKKLYKDEFETTQMFQKRLEKERARVQKYNEKLKKSYEAAVQSASAGGQKLDPDVIRDKALQAAFYLRFGAPEFSSIRYDADKGVFHITVSSQKGNFASTQTVAVPLKYAKRYKEILAAASPAVAMRAADGVLRLESVRQLEHPVFLVEKNIFLHLKTIEDYTSFLKEYPDSPFSAEARMRLAELENDRKTIFQTLIGSENIQGMRDFIQTYPNSEYSKRIQKRIDTLMRAKTERRRKELLAAQEAERKAYAARKTRGDLVCRNVGVSFGLIHIEVKGYVEDVAGDKIQIRIVQTYGAQPRIDGVTLYQNTIIWDRYNLWKLCE